MKKPLILIALIVTIVSCTKKVIEDIPADSFRISILPVSIVAFNQYSFTGTLDAHQTSDDIEYGLVVSKSINPTLEDGVKYSVGKSKISTDFTCQIKGLDTGVAYYVRAYGIGNSEAQYSANQVIGKLSPQIISVDNVLNYGRTFTIVTNLGGIDTSTIKGFLNNMPIQLTFAGLSNQGQVIYGQFTKQLTPGTYTFSLSIGNFTISYAPKLTLFEGTWEKLGDVPFAYPFAGGRAMDGFIVGDWIYFDGFLAGGPVAAAAQFYKYNYKTGEQRVLTSFDSTNTKIIINNTVVAENNLLHLFGGEISEGYYESSSTHYIYNTTADTWKRAADIPGGPREKAVGYLYNNKIYFGLGFKFLTSTYYTDFYSYDSSNDTWTGLASFPGTTGRYFNASFIIGSKIYVVGGVNNNNSVTGDKSTWCYDITTNTWSKKADFPGIADYNYYSFTASNFGYVGGGMAIIYTPYIGQTHFYNCYKYDPDNDRWTEVSNFGISMNYPVCGSSADGGIVAGGMDDLDVPLTGIYKFTP